MLALSRNKIELQVNTFRSGAVADFEYSEFDCFYLSSFYIKITAESRREFGRAVRI